MARKTAIIKIGAEGGRDTGRIYSLTELPAAQAEKWAARAVLALNRAGAEIPEELASQGMRGLLAVQPDGAGVSGIMGMVGGVLRGLHWEDAEPLLDEMMACVQIIPDERNQAFSRPLLEDDIEEVSTRLKLRMEVWKLHTDFFSTAAP